jgi:hypothetical protein
MSSPLEKDKKKACVYGFFLWNPKTWMHLVNREEPISKRQEL